MCRTYVHDDGIRIQTDGYTYFGKPHCIVTPKQNEVLPCPHSKGVEKTRFEYCFLLFDAISCIYMHIFYRRVFFSTRLQIQELHSIDRHFNDLVYPNAKD